MTSSIKISFEASCSDDGKYCITSPDVKDFSIWLGSPPETQEDVLNLVTTSLCAYFICHDVVGRLLLDLEDPSDNLCQGGKFSCVMVPKV